MGNWKQLLVVPALLLASACEVTTDEPAPVTGMVAIENVTVVPMDAARLMPASTVLIEADTIVAVGPVEEVAVPAGAERIDGSGLFLMPGLAEMHAHLPLEDDPAGITDTVLTLFAVRGVTFARGMFGADHHPALRDEVAAGERFGPTLIVASPFMSGGIETPEAAREHVRRYAAAGFDLLKIGEGLSPEVYEAIVEEAREQRIPFAGHVPDAVGLLAALEVGQRTIDHLDNYVEALRGPDAPDDFPAVFGAASLIPHVERERIRELVDATLDGGAAVVPTMVLWERFFSDAPIESHLDDADALRYVPESMVETWMELLGRIQAQAELEHGPELLALRREILSALHGAGVYVLLGSDAPQAFNVPGFSIHDEMRFMQDEVGLPPFEVLFAGTRAVAEHLGTPEAFGTVLPGRRADLLLVRGNPLEDVAHAADIAGVMLRGQWLSERDLDARLEALARQYRRE